MHNSRWAVSVGLGTRIQHIPQSIRPDTIDFSVLWSWLDDCKTHHSGCQLPNIIPLKLIHCQTRHVEQLQHHEPYCALRYIWGMTSSNSKQSTDDATEQEIGYHTQVSLSLPNTIEDALKSTLALHFRYLWVDRYCIDQKRPNEN